jgi:hypothetical protein
MLRKLCHILPGFWLRLHPGYVGISGVKFFLSCSLDGGVSRNPGNTWHSFPGFRLRLHPGYVGISGVKFFLSCSLDGGVSRNLGNMWHSFPDFGYAFIRATWYLRSEILSIFSLDGGVSRNPGNTWHSFPGFRLRLHPGYVGISGVKFFLSCSLDGGVSRNPGSMWHSFPDFGYAFIRATWCRRSKILFYLVAWMEALAVIREVCGTVSRISATPSSGLRGVAGVKFFSIL